MSWSQAKASRLNLMLKRSLLAPKSQWIGGEASEENMAAEPAACLCRSGGLRMGLTLRAVDLSETCCCTSSKRSARHIWSSSATSPFLSSDTSVPGATAPT